MTVILWVHCEVTVTVLGEESTDGITMKSAVDFYVIVICNRLHGVSRWLLHCYESSNDIAVKFSGYSRVTTTKSLWPLLYEKLLSDFIVMSLEASSQRNCDGDFTVESLNDYTWEHTTIHENTRRYMRTHDDTWDTYNFIVIWSGDSSQSGNYGDFTVESPNDNYLSIIMRRIKYNKF